MSNFPSRKTVGHARSKGSGHSASGAESADMEDADGSGMCGSAETQRGPASLWVFPVYCAKKHSAVSDDATLRGAGRHLFFLSSFSLTTVARSLASPYRA